VGGGARCLLWPSASTLALLPRLADGVFQMSPATCPAPPAGKEACKNWQQSIKVEGFTMNGDPSGPGMKMGHFVRIVGIQTSNSTTEFGM
jgi:hypothetical protein